MPENTLERIHELLPGVRLQQTYGLSEVGILRSKSKSSDSLWVKVGGEGFETRIVDGMLEIKARSAMLGYLNAPSPFTNDGWLKTGDVVEQDGEYIRILRRDSEIINVGGEKVYPAEVERVHGRRSGGRRRRGAPPPNGEYRGRSREVEHRRGPSGVPPAHAELLQGQARSSQDPAEGPTCCRSHGPSSLEVVQAPYIVGGSHTSSRRSRKSSW